ncbi:MAG: DNA alkylation repair protein [Acidimicrobiia bacterium]|nr:DNA alkylation repair protein [Acidimicrobiia bacterium]
MGDAPLLKDFVDRESVTAIVGAVAVAAGGLDEDTLLELIFDSEWEERALKQRIRHIAVSVRSFLPPDYAEALRIMRDAARTVDGGWMSVWSFNDFVEEYGVDHPDISLPALEQFTKLASSEFAVRPFIVSYPVRMAKQMLAWASHSDPAVRRLASEGYRPRLPWGMGLPELKKDPSPIIPVLEELRRDPSEDVRRSVANNLNDISKDHPDLVVRLLGEWKDGTPETAALIKHALRTLLKQGHPGALELLGFPQEVHVELVAASVDPVVARVGESTVLNLKIRSTADAPQRLMVDYAVIFQNASGTGSRKVYKGAAIDLNGGETFVLERKISLAQRTTRRIIAGPHSVEIQVNGAVLAAVPFDVVA